MKKILNIIPDDKFSKGSIEFYSHVNSINTRFFTIKKKPYKYLNPEVESFTLWKAYKIIRKSQFDAIIFNGLGIKTTFLLLILNTKSKIIWRTYGNDIYSLFYCHKYLLKPITYKYFI